MVQETLRRIIEAVFEPNFYDEMMGFRPGRGCHKAIQKINVMLEMRPTNYVLDADVKGFFEHIDHEWIVKFIESRIKAPNIIRLVRRMLKAGITDNIQGLDNFRFRMMQSLFKWLNRRSQKRSYTWRAFNNMLNAYPLAIPKIYVSVYAR